MSEGRRVLVVEDDADARDALDALLSARGHRVESAETLAGARERLEAASEQGQPEIVLLDLVLPDGDGMELLRWTRQRRDRPATVVLTGEQRLARAVEAMRLGAFDYLPKPLDGATLDEALTRLDRHLDDRESRTGREEPDQPRDGLAPADDYHGLVGRAPAMQRVYELVERVAPSRIPVFVHGESGTGKEVLARALHAVSRRRRRQFLAVNCGAIPENLVESELFGHERGAFTGATARRAGVFEQADGGTLFLDELPGMPYETQVKLLRVLETGTIRRVGGSIDVPVDVRLVSATNVDPDAAVAEGRLREDLFYRLHVFPITMPPLRQRREDVPLLARSFLARIAAAEGGPEPDVDPEALEVLKEHDWPGNVRELRNAVTRAWLLADDARIRREHLGDSVEPRAGDEPEAGPGSTPADEGAIRLPFGATLAEAERTLAEAYLRHFGGHRTRTARALGISPRTLYNKCHRWGLDPDRYRPARGERHGDRTDPG